MNTLIIYDSVHGNTAKIAKAIGKALVGEVSVRHVNEGNFTEVKRFDFLIVGSPTHGGRPTEAIQDFIKNVPESTLQNTNVATFDTRFSTILVRVFGYAAPRIANSLKKKGGILVTSPEGFFVKGREGPLKEGEIERAASWAKEILRLKSS